VLALYEMTYDRLEDKHEWLYWSVPTRVQWCSNDVQSLFLVTSGMKRHDLEASKCEGTYDVQNSARSAFDE
jgi:hypothetical protein